MQSLPTRAGRRPLARTIVLLLGLGALGACADETTAPTTNAPSRAAANTAAASAEPYTTSVDLDITGAATFTGYAGAFIGVELACSTNQVVDLIVGLEQEQKAGSTTTLAQGFGFLSDVECTPAPREVTVLISPYPNAVFQPGRATVYAQVTNTQPGVEPANVKRRVRLTLLG